MVFGFNNLPEAEPEENEPNAPAPPAQAERQRVYQLMKESTFQSLLQRGVPVQLSEQPSQRGFVTVYMDLTPEQRRQLELGWSGMRTSPTFSKNLSSLASANRGRGYGSGYGIGHGSGGQRNRNRSRSRERKPINRNTRNRNRNRNENRNRTRNLRNRERAEENASRLGYGSVLPDANDDQLAALLSGLRF
jgi:hypothetical protein